VSSQGEEDRLAARFRFWSVEQLLQAPSAAWLIEPLFEVGGLTVLYGPSESGKTFVALDWALSVATGQPWMGRSVKQAKVVYVAAEGARGMQKRVKAWMEKRGITQIDQVYFVPEPIELLDEDHIKALSRHLAEQKPEFIVFDTMASCFGDGDENTARDVGRMVTAIRNLQKIVPATVLLLHHTVKSSGDVERGSNALRGAADTMILQKKDSNGRITLTNKKQKDHEPFENISLKLVPADLHLQAHVYRSCVLQDGQAGGVRLLDGLDAAQDAFTVLLSFPDSTARFKDWRVKVNKSARTLNNWIELLLKAGLIERIPPRGTYRALEKK